MKAYQLVIFDWDGTLMDSTERIVRCLAAAAQDTGLLRLADDAYRSIIGLGLIEAIQALYPNESMQQVVAMRDHYADHFVVAEKVPNPLFPTVADTLAVLRDGGVTMAVATGKSRRGLDRVWSATGLGHWFAGSRCADETRSKPDPTMLYQLLEQFGVAPEQALMVGDTTFDLEMAERAGIDRVGVLYGAHSAELLRQHRPLALIDRLEQMLELISLPAAQSLEALDGPAR